MNLTRSKKSLMLFLIGFILIILDVNITTGISYPQEYNNSDSTIGEYQFYNIKSVYGATCTYKMIFPESKDSSSDNAVVSSTGSQGTKVIDKVYYSNIRIDIFNDFVGFVLIFIAAMLLQASSTNFKLAKISCISSMILFAMMFALPFFMNGIALCNFVFVIGFAYLFSGVFATFFYTKGIFSLAKDICCRDERRWLQCVWFIVAVGMCLTTFVKWLGSDYPTLIGMSILFTIVMIMLLILFYVLANRIIDYVEEGYNRSK